MSPVPTLKHGSIALLGASHDIVLLALRIFRWEPSASAEGAGLQSSEEASRKNRGFSHGHFEGPALKRERDFPPKFRSAQALLPRMNAGAPTWARTARKNAAEALSSHYTTRL